MKFLTNWTIDLGKLAEEKYTAFNGEFTMQLDYGVLKLLNESKFITDNQRKNLIPLLLNTNKKTGQLKCKHNQRFNVGRYYADSKHSPICVSRIIKHTLFTYLGWIDLDMVKGHPTIIKQVASKMNYATPEIDRYLANPTGIFEQLIKHYTIKDTVTEDDVKDIFNLAIYGGGHSTWQKQMHEDGKVITAEEHDIVKKFIKEIRAIADIVYKSNPELSKRVVSDEDELDEYEKKSRVMSYWCGAFENHIVHLATKLLIKEKWIVPKSFAPEYDGVCFKDPGVDDDAKAVMIEKINLMIKQKTGMDVKMKFKEYKEDKICRPILEARAMLNDKPTSVSDDEDSKDAVDYGNVVENDKQAVDVVYSAVKETLKYSKGITYYKVGGIWIIDDKEIRSALQVLVSKFGLLKNVYGKFVSYTSKRSSWVTIASGVIDMAMTNPCDDWCNSIFASSLGYILFNNGYWDFKRCCFVENDSDAYDDSIVFIEKISYDFNHTLNLDDDEELDYINSVQKRLFTDPFGEAVGSYYCEKIARGLAGDCQKNFLLGVGSGNTGKSILNSVCKNACGGYFGAFNGSNIKYKAIANNDDAQALRWLLLLRWKRIIVSSELPMGFPIDGNMIKKMSNGGLDPITARVHGGNETEFMTAAFPILFANDIDQIKPCDDAVKNRLVCVNYSKVFVDEPVNQFQLKKDDNLGNEIQTLRFKNAFIWCLINAYKRFHVDNERVDSPPLQEMSAAFDSIVGDDGDDIITKFEKDFEITNNPDDYVRSFDIETWLKGSQVSIKKFSVEMNKHKIIRNLSNVYSKNKKLGKVIKVWQGIRILKEEDIENGGEE